MSSIVLKYGDSLDGLEQERLEEVGSRIKALRKAQKMSQTDLAQRVGLSRRSISDIENGGNTTLVSFMRILSVFSRLDEFDQVLKSNSISPKAAFEAQSKRGAVE